MGSKIYNNTEGPPGREGTGGRSERTTATGVGW